MKRFLLLAALSLMMAGITETIGISAAAEELINENQAEEEYVESVSLDTLMDTATIIASGECGPDATWTLYSNRTVVISGTGTISDKLKDCVPWDFTVAIINEGITSIGKEAFFYCASLTDISIPNSVISIGEQAFWLCTHLINITIPDSVTTIGWDAFMQCYSLTNITIPDSVTIIENGTFASCTSLTNITIPDSVTTISGFTGCTSLTNITIPDSVTTISGFTGCTSLTNITIPDNVECIGAYAFCDCTSLTNITIPDRVTTIEGGTFEGCTSLTNITIPNNVERIDAYAFGNCTSLTNIMIPDNVKYIDGYAFHHCTSLTNISIPDNVVHIGDHAFYHCTSLTNIIIPSSVIIIEDRAFSQCFSLTDIIVDVSNTEYTSIDGILYDKNVSELLQCPGGKVTATIPDSVAKIGESAFDGCTALTNIIIPNSVTYIGVEAFSYCSSLSNIEIPDSVHTIEVSAFSHCSSLTSILIPTSVDYIGVMTFLYCHSSLTIYGYSGSYAEKYASNYKYAFIAVDDDTITLQANGGLLYDSDLSKQVSSLNYKVTLFEKYGNLPIPKRELYDFAGWYTRESGGIRITADSYVSLKHKTLYARWVDQKLPVLIKGNYPSGTFDTGYFFTSSTDRGNTDLMMLSALASYTTYYAKEWTSSPLEFLDNCGFDKTTSLFSGTGSSSNRWNNDHGTLYIGMRDIHDKDGTTFTLVAAIISGYSGDGYEWISNFNVGSGSYHIGFKNAADEITKLVNEYVDKNVEGKSVKYWLTGHSRGAALTNIVAKNLTDENSKKDVYAYGFATPRYYGGSHISGYDNIINLISPDDFVPQVAPEDWGFGRLGQNYEFSLSFRDMMIAEFQNCSNSSYMGSNSKQMKALINGFTTIAPDQISYNSKSYTILTSAAQKEHLQISDPIDVFGIRPFEYCQKGLSLAMNDNWVVKGEGIAYMLAIGIRYGGVFSQMNHLLIGNKTGANDAHIMRTYLMWLAAGTELVRESQGGGGFR